MEVDPTSAWARPELPSIDPNTESIGAHPNLTKVFQQIDVEECQLPHSPPAIRMYGSTMVRLESALTEIGRSSCARSCAWIPALLLCARASWIHAGYMQ